MSFAREGSIIYKTMGEGNRRSIRPAALGVETVPMNVRIIKRDRVEVNGRNARDRENFFRARTLAVLALVSLASGTMFSCGVERKADRLYREAQEDVRAGRLESAVERYAQIVRDYPTSEAARLARSEMELYRGLAKAERMYPVREVHRIIVNAARAIERYHARRRAWPETLHDLVPGELADYPVDPWGRLLLYQRKPRGRGYLLASLGADGERGGAGELDDVFVEDGEFVRAPSLAWP
jgi:hypothetical protein